MPAAYIYSAKSTHGVTNHELAMMFEQATGSKNRVIHMRVHGRSIHLFTPPRDPHSLSRKVHATTHQEHTMQQLLPDNFCKFEF